MAGFYEILHKVTFLFDKVTFLGDKVTFLFDNVTFLFANVTTTYLFFLLFAILFHFSVITTNVLQR